MLTTQLLGVSPFGFYGPLGDGTPEEIKGLQQALINAGKCGVTADGNFTPETVAATYEVIRDKSAQFSNLSFLQDHPDIRDVMTSLRDADNAIKANVPSFLGISGIGDILRRLDNLNDLIQLIGPACETCQDVANAINGAVKKAMQVTSNAAGTLKTIISKIAPTSAPAPACAGTKPLPGGGGGAPSRPASKIFTTLPSGAFKKAITAIRPVVPGTIYAFSKKLGKFRVAIPKTAAVTPPIKTAGFGYGGLGIMTDGAFGGTCIFGDCGLGAAATFTEIAPVATPPAAPATQVTETELEKRTGTLPFFKNPVFWIATIGGVAVVGGGGYWLMRRRKKAAAAAPAKAAHY